MANVHIHRINAQVRALCVCELGVITASRDKTIKLWKEVEGQYVVESTYVGHQGYVTAVTYAPPGLLEGFDKGAIVSGILIRSLPLNCGCHLWDLLDSSRCP